MSNTTLPQIKLLSLDDYKQSLSELKEDSPENEETEEDYINRIAGELHDLGHTVTHIQYDLENTRILGNARYLAVIHYEITFHK